MRDRLIELLFESEQFNDADGKADANTLADHLLKNNVIVLSCKVGDKVYENYHGHIFEYVITSIEISSPYDIVYKVRATEPWNRFVRFIGFDKYDIGETIFLTREEAERALKGGDE